MNYTFLQQLLSDCAEYEANRPDQSGMASFSRWLAAKYAQSDANEPKMPNIAPEHMDPSIVKLMFHLTRYAKMYSKKALESTPISTMDEFVYLATLLEVGSCTKTYLIKRHRHEKPTGTEIIARLLEANLVAQTADLNDKRSKQLHLTPAGASLAYQLFGIMAPIAQHFTGDLNDAEKVQLAYLLQRLEDFHQDFLKRPIVK